MTTYGIYINGEATPITFAVGTEQRDKVIAFYRKSDVPVTYKKLK